MTQEMAICDWMAVILFTTRLTNILMWLDGFAIDNSGLFYVYNRTHQDFSHISRLLLQLPINPLLIRVCSVCCLSSSSTAKCCHNLWRILILRATHKCFCQNGTFGHVAIRGRLHIMSVAITWQVSQNTDKSFLDQWQKTGNLEIGKKWAQKQKNTAAQSCPSAKHQWGTRNAGVVWHLQLSWSDLSVPQSAEKLHWFEKSELAGGEVVIIHWQ